MESWLRPMLCGTADVVPTDPKWVLEGKLDGWRSVCHREQDRVRACGGRNGSNYSGQLPYVEAALLDLLPPTRRSTANSSASAAGATCRA